MSTRQIFKTILIILSIIFCYPFTQGKAEEQKRAMTFLDIIQMKRLGWQEDISPDGKLFIYTISVPDQEKSGSFSDIYITPLNSGKTKQMTFTKYKNESSPKWYKDSSLFAFSSNRSEDKNQIYFMRPDGGEAWKVTDDKYGAGSFQWSRDWKYLAYLGGKPEERQIWIMPGQGGEAEKLTDHKTHVSSFFWNPNSKKVYFVALDSIDLLDKERKEKVFDVVIKDEIKIPSHLWEIDIEAKKERRLTGGNEYSVLRSVISEDGTKNAFFGSSTERYGEKFKKGIVGDYFGLSFDDIMTGVDYLIERGIVEPDSMGIMGWSAGGDLSNGALVCTNRFKAISTGAGGVVYYDWDNYVFKESPLKYIKNTKTPTLIHCGEDDTNNIHQCEELHTALKKLGVPTEFIVYPNMGHGISEMRYQMVKMQAEFNWFEKWIRGKEGWIDWKEMIETLEKEKKE